MSNNKPRHCYLAIDENGKQHFYDNKQAFEHLGLSIDVEFIEHSAYQTAVERAERAEAEIRSLLNTGMTTGQVATAETIWAQANAENAQLQERVTQLSIAVEKAQDIIKQRDASQALLAECEAWISKNHEMPGYSELLLKLRQARGE